MADTPPPIADDRQDHLRAALRLLDGLADGQVHDEDVMHVADGVRRHLEKAGLA